MKLDNYYLIKVSKLIDKEVIGYSGRNILNLRINFKSSTKFSEFTIVRNVRNLIGNNEPVYIDLFSKKIYKTKVEVTDRPGILIVDVSSATPMTSIFAKQQMKKRDLKKFINSLNDEYKEKQKVLKK